MPILTKSLEIGNLKLKNRLVMPPMATLKADSDGKVSSKLLEYYDEKSKGGYISLIIIEHSYITEQGKVHERQLSVANDNLIEKLSELADIIHKNGSKTIMQLNHAGSASRKVIKYEPVGPSSVHNPRTDRVPKELNKEEINTIVQQFASAAQRVKEAGFDGVEIHSAHGYLLNQFFSPLTNQRTDEYGGNVLNRIRIHLEIIKAIRTKVGKDFTIFLRLGACDYLEGGISIDDSKIAAQEFEKAGLDVLDISGGFSGYIIPGLDGQGFFSPLTEEIKKVVSIPVILTGGITEVNAAEQLLLDGRADLIGVGRAIYNDSNWAQKAIECMK